MCNALHSFQVQPLSGVFLNCLKKTYVLIVIRSVRSGVRVSKSALSRANNKLFAIQSHEILDQIESFQVRHWGQITRVPTFPR